MWKDYVEEQFDNIAHRVKKEIDSGEEAMEQYEPSVSVPEEIPISPFSTSLLPLLQSDLSVDIRDAFLYAIDQAMVSSATFINEGNNTVVLEEQNGVNVQEILPKDFPVQGDIVHFPLPLNKDCTPTTVHAHHFGPRGADIDKLTKHLFEKVLFDALPKRDTMVDETIEPYPMKMALNKYMANFKNLWSNKLRYTRLFNGVITALLKIHLVPKLERLKREKKNYGSGAQKLRLQLQRAKKANAQRISSAGNAASRKSIKKDESVTRLEEWYQQTARHREQLRNFYYLPTRVRQNRTYELQMPRYIDKLCSNKRRYVTGSDKSQHIMFVGDRGYCVGPTIKGHLKYGGQWKSRKNTVNGTFQCVNPDCPSVLAGKATHVRDSLSAMAIGLSGLATLLFGATFPQFDPKRSPSKTAEFEHFAATF
ncbi:hypothetical protein G6F70_007578 [Rhizopus microsporus]|nr:hypothetical protein G6F71_007564 [Rhizopus microsporus]KAG1196275.1 hypothetical protein G6F70_007578 [Rhizopus microsporus]KAG1208068.1 hypothetical protein G6F69_007531 [Rhizopus microsporus]KAG1229165.1 hypothetical protein G6F67_007342 [Rhizopus microsporus]KAG1261179.1 hypothetical protein G6F68_006876 [Rhizopus microsporus]